MSETETGDDHAVVLAAGMGRRLQPLTDDTPKALLEVDGQPILGHILDRFTAANYERVTIVTGHEAAQIRAYCEETNGLDVECVHSDAYRETNNSYSLWLARDRIREGFTLVNGDTLFPADCLERLRDVDDSVLVVDAKDSLNGEEMKVAIEDGRVTAVGKDLPDADGEYIGLCKFGPEDADALVRQLDDLVETGRTDEWYEAAFDRLVADRPLGVVTVRDRWIEIDDREDLRAGRQLWGEA
ncbi:putative sugar nucleotidyltransferase [Halovivax ruber XH-70]|uniref:Putative sugar nucleotidyltransferase n=1 Tax=Halovivax ruber (strain DSM 18193 / JCM 13892 / XH-70) TaxID=797302 RepID=L0I7Q2_HALRX|nr:phosphocholine cytidylyltransferase family protein [Halovivax ruber]AGB15620.1 putative sugar nucleotidyltransferase [Halovivax ruber XH-70]